MGDAAIRHPLLDDLGVAHGFGTRTSAAPEGLVRPRQVHGTAVAHSTLSRDAQDEEADAIVTRVPARAVGILTADCVPILLCAEDGRGVAAIHAGWRGLAAGVIEEGVAALRSKAGAAGRLFAVVGPHVGPCCYEVDAPVLDAMTQRFMRHEIETASTETRKGHARIDLGRLSRDALMRSGVAPSDCAQIARACTACDADRFHSYRRGGAAAGRLVHFIISR
ncbi:MAG: peptidoglycan editing factor PgeF [Myxococcota bacterium]|jgi:hypothetical protein|nr:peptidoglycan editing factor PgeF [Myxococcota bacterium]